MPTYKFTGSVNISAPNKKEANRQFNTHYAGIMIQEAKCEEVISINDVQHSLRQKAIEIIEEILEPLVGHGIQGESYYDLEDKITNLLNK
jgi:hypothetical protein